jgi:hypothetical protein
MVVNEMDDFNLLSIAIMIFMIISFCLYLVEKWIKSKKEIEIERIKNKS